MIARALFVTDDDDDDACGPNLLSLVVESALHTSCPQVCGSVVETSNRRQRTAQRLALSCLASRLVNTELVSIADKLLAGNFDTDVLHRVL